jgi:hypothetical protein
MTDRMTDLSAFGPRRRNRSATGEAGHAERRARAALAEKRLPDATEGRHAVPVSKAPALLTEDQRRRAASYSLPERVLKQRAVDALRAEISEPVKEVARRYRLNLLATRVAEQIYRAQRAAGDVYISLSAADIAKTLNSAPQQAGANALTADQVRCIIEALTKLGALGQKPSSTFNIGFNGTAPAFKLNVA